MPCVPADLLSTLQADVVRRGVELRRLVHEYERLGLLRTRLPDVSFNCLFQL